MGWSPGRVSKIWVSGRSLPKFRSYGGSKIAFFLFKSHRLYNSFVLPHMLWCWWYSLCIVTTLSDANCTPEWVRRERTFDFDSRQHPGASTLEGCQKACEFDPRCVSVDWMLNEKRCLITTQPRYGHDSISNLEHYELVSRCNITSGQWSTVYRTL